MVRNIPCMRVATLCLAMALTLSAGGALAQQRKGQGGHRSQPQQMSQKDRQQMRDDMRDAYRDRSRDRQRPMTREERDKLRQDIQEANKQMRR